MWCCSIMQNLPTCSTQKLPQWTHSKYLTSFFLSRMWCVSLFLYIGIPSTTIHFWCPVWYAVAWLLIDFLYKNNPKYCAMNRLPSVTPPPHICQMWNVNSRFSLLINHDQWSTGGWNYEVILLLLFSVKIVLASMLYLYLFFQILNRQLWLCVIRPPVKQILSCPDWNMQFIQIF